MPIRVGNEEYDIPSKEATAIAEGVERAYNMLGRPTDTKGETGWKMMDNLVGVWFNFYPWELKAWEKELSLQLGNERSVGEALKAHGGYIPISFPTRLYKMIETYLPDVKVTERVFIRKFATRYPIFKFTKHKI